MYRYYSYKQFYDILVSNGIEAYFREMTDVNTDEDIFIYFFIMNTSSLNADDKIHVQQARISIQIYSKSILDENSNEKLKLNVQNLINVFQVMPLITNQESLLQDYNCTIFEIPISTNIIDWL